MPRKRKRLEKLNPRQEKFVRAYIECGVGSKAAIAAGYSEKCAESQASYLLNDPKVHEYIEKLNIKKAAHLVVTIGDVVDELIRILMADPLDAYEIDGTVKPLHEWPKDLRRALSGIKTKEIFSGRGDDREQIGQIKEFKFWSKTESSKQLMMHLGGFKADNEQKGAALSELIAMATGEDIDNG